MRKALVAVVVVVILAAFALYRLLAPSPPPAEPLEPAAAPSAQRLTESGPVIGFAAPDDTYAWLGIPYAAPPVGALRWRAPRPPADWSEPLQALRPGPSCPQIANPLSGVPGAPRGSIVGSEDCLYLNVWAPRSAGPRAAGAAGGLPVMVWIHGGGNTLGTGSVYSGVHGLAGPYGLIVVTLNYRLGVLGWLHHPALPDEAATPEDASGNFGTLDLIAALRWVRQNIAAFGGDSGNVTVFGESAGGVNTYALLASPLARGLFHRAILQSPLPTWVSVAQAAHLRPEREPPHPTSSRELLDSLLIAAGRAADREQARALQEQMSPAEIRDELRRRSPEALLAPFIAASGFAMYAWMANIGDGHVLPAEPIVEVLADPVRYNAVPVIVGTNRDEMKFFQAFHPQYVSYWFGRIPRIRDAHAYERDAAYTSDMWRLVGAHAPASAMRAAQGPDVYVYRFDWDEMPRNWLVDMQQLIGAGHGLEVGFVLGRSGAALQLLRGETPQNAAGREQLSRAMRSYWTQFAHGGAPGRGRDGALPLWQPWSTDPADARLLVLDTEAGGGIRMERTELDAAQVERRLLTDPSLAAEPREQCRLYLALFRDFAMFVAGSWDREAYERFAGGRCRDYPPEAFPVFGS